MNILVYDWEIYDRWIWWYITVFSLFIFFVILIFFAKNYQWVVLLILLFWWYLYLSIWKSKKLELSMEDEWLKLGVKLFPWDDLLGFSLELDNKTQKIKNIVISTKSDNYIHTIAYDLWASTLDNIKAFILELSEKTSMLQSYNQTTFEKFIRLIKL